MIPFYKDQEAIQQLEGSSKYFVILDMQEVDKINDDMWVVFDEVKEECEEQLGLFLVISEANISVSPAGDKTYIVHLEPLDEPSVGYVQ